MIKKRELKERIELLYKELGYDFMWFDSAGGLLVDKDYKKIPITRGRFNEDIAEVVKRIYSLEEKNKALEEYLGIEFTENNTKGYHKIKKKNI